MKKEIKYSLIILPDFFFKLNFPRLSAQNFLVYKKKMTPLKNFFDRILNNNTYREELFVLFLFLNRYSCNKFLHFNIFEDILCNSIRSFLKHAVFSFIYFDQKMALFEESYIFLFIYFIWCHHKVHRGKTKIRVNKSGDVWYPILLSHFEKKNGQHSHCLRMVPSDFVVY